jgi:hypothetical protein
MRQQFSGYSVVVPDSIEKLLLLILGFLFGILGTPITRRLGERNELENYRRALYGELADACVWIKSCARSCAKHVDKEARKTASEIRIVGIDAYLNAVKSNLFHQVKDSDQLGQFYVLLRQLKESPAYSDLELINQAEILAYLIIEAFKSGDLNSDFVKKVKPRFYEVYLDPKTERESGRR